MCVGRCVALTLTPPSTVVPSGGDSSGGLEGGSRYSPAARTARVSPAGRTESVRNRDRNSTLVLVDSWGCCGRGGGFGPVRSLGGRRDGAGRGRGAVAPPDDCRDNPSAREARPSRLKVVPATAAGYTVCMLKRDAVILTYIYIYIPTRPIRIFVVPSAMHCAFTYVCIYRPCLLVPIYIYLYTRVLWYAKVWMGRP